MATDRQLVLRVTMTRIVAVLGLLIALVGLYLLVTWLSGARDTPRLLLGVIATGFGLAQLRWGARRLGG